MEQIGRYQIEAELGRGAMGVVFRALDPAIGRTVAIKTIVLADFVDPAEQDRLHDRLLHEAQSAGILSHPGIVTVYDVGEEDGVAYISMEFVNGHSLEQMLSEERALDSETALRVLRETAAALDYAHKKGIVHRDIKPANVMIDEDGTVKIADFGVAKLSASHQLTQAGTVLGTPNYMSPEQVQGKPVDGRSDQFSLAVIAYEMLTGEKPFTAEQLPTLVYKIVHDEPPPPNRLNPSLAWQVEVVLRKAMEKEPEARYSTCSEFARALEGACSSSKGWKPLPRGGSQSLPTVVAEAPPVGRRSARELHEGPADKGKHTGKWVALAGLLLALAVASGAGLYLGWFHRSQPPANVSQPEVSQAEPPPAPPSGRPSPSGPATGTSAPGTNVIQPAQETSAERTAQKSSVPETAAPPVPEASPPPASTSTPSSASPAVTTPATRGQEAPPAVPPLQEQQASPQSSEVLVRTSPPGATIIFDHSSQTACKTPCSRSLTEGRHTAAATLSGHRPALRIFQVPRDSDLFLYLPEMTGQVQVLSDPSGAAVVINGESRKERTPVTLDLPVGKYTISVTKEGYGRDQQQIEVKDNAFVRISFTLAKQ